MRVTAPRETYLNDVFGLDDPELRAVREELVQEGADGISISGFEARILQFLIRLSGARRVLEIGTLFGFSALAMAKVLPEDGELITLEKNPQNHERAIRHFANAPAGKKIRALLGDASESLKSLQGPFDLVFIDADKAAYPRYLDWAEANVRSGGLIVGDNTFLFGGVFDGSENPKSAAMREFNSRLADPSKYNSTLLPTVEGLTVAQRL